MLKAHLKKFSRPLIVAAFLILLLLAAVGYLLVSNPPAAPRHANGVMEQVPYAPSNPDYEGSVFSLTVSSQTTKADIPGSLRLALSDINEPIDITYQQGGRDRTFVIHVYYDYKPVAFRVGETGDFDSTFVFDMDDKTGYEFPIYLDPEIQPDDQVHRLIIDFVPGYTEYAKDKEGQDAHSSFPQMYELVYRTDSGTQASESAYPLEKPASYLDRQSIPILLNLNAAVQGGAPYTDPVGPEKLYTLPSSSGALTMNYALSNVEPLAETALVFLTVGHQPVKVNGQDYVWLDLDWQTMSVGQCSFDAPEDPGFYDIIGYVVFDPFLPITNDERSFPSTGIRFTLEITDG